MKKKTKSFIISAIETVLLALILSFLLLHFVFMSVSVDGQSMMPNLMPEDRGLSFIISRKINIKRFDIAVIKVDGKDTLLIKRIIGLPNEKVEWTDSKLYIDGEYVEEDFLGDNIVTADYAIELGEDEYLCAGDNRPISRDSRNYYGPFKGEDILSTGIFVFYPFERMGLK